jgi:hypothetical protein
LQWLSPYDVSTNHNAACDKHEPSTGGWFFQLEEFKSWKEGPGGMIWIHGIRMNPPEEIDRLDSG